jgi:regulatory protein
MRTSGLSLKARAIGFLSRRDHSRVELTRKLGPHAESAEQIESLLNDLEQAKYLSEDRFAQSLVRRRGAKYGVLRIKAELIQHKLSDDLLSHTVATAKRQELASARAVFAKKYTSPAVDTPEIAKRMRFLATRGFSPEVIRQVMRSDPE